MNDYGHDTKQHPPLRGLKMALGPSETHAAQETKREIAARLAALEAIDPSQRRPTPRRSILNKVDYIDL